jgi:hypothetical protein
MTSKQLDRVRQLLWLYFWLLIFEGALRRWILPGLSEPLLLVRDPVAVVTLMQAWPIINRQPWRGWIQPSLWIGAIAVLLALTIGHRDIITALYGGRILILQLPMIFVYAAVFNRDDVVKLAWMMLWVSIPMTVLIATQSSLPETHFLNIGPGGVGTSVFDGAGGRFRPPGTFTFITGVASFFALAAASLFGILYSTSLRNRGRIFCIGAGIALMVALPVSISRDLLAGYLTVVGATIVALIQSRAPAGRLLSGFLAILFAIGLATTVPAFQETSGAFIARWESAAKADREEVSDINIASQQFESRVLGEFTRPLSKLDEISFTGYGIGAGTNVGAQRLTGGLTFLVGEGSWDASLGELGLPLGLAFLFWRTCLAIWIVQMALRAARRGNRLPMIFAGAAFLDVLVGQVSQPTGLGFVVLSGGLCLAACNPGPSSQAEIQS